MNENDKAVAAAPVVAAAPTLERIGWQYRFIDAKGYRDRGWTDCTDQDAERIRAHKDDPDWQVYELREVYVKASHLLRDDHAPDLMGAGLPSGESASLSVSASSLIWRRIESAPNPDLGYSPVVLLCDQRGNRWTDVWPGESWDHNGCGLPPTHWMDLPEPP